MKKILLTGLLLFFTLTISCFVTYVLTQAKTARDLVDVSYSVGSIAIMNTEKTLVVLNAIDKHELTPDSIMSHLYVINSIFVDLLSIKSRLSNEQKKTICDVADYTSVKKTMLNVIQNNKDNNFWSVTGFVGLVEYCGANK